MFYDIYVSCISHIHISYLTFASYYIYSKQVENIIAKANTNNEISQHRYSVNMKLDPLNEEIIYREYIICLKKHQLAIE